MYFNSKLYKLIRVCLFMLVITSLSLGIYLRFVNLNWDSGHYFHPDERNIAAAVSRIKFFSQLDPQFFAYGGFSIYLYRALGELLSVITKKPEWVTDWGFINLIGRNVSALFSSLSIITVYLYSKKVFDKNTALLSLIIVSFTVTFIQISHFSVTETQLIFFQTIAVILSTKIVNTPKNSLYLLLGIILGISVAIKTSGIAFLIFPLLTFLLAIRKPITPRKIVIHIVNHILVAAVSILTFTIFSPYTFLSWNKFMESMKYESGVVNGSLQVPYTMQFTNALPYFFQIKNLFWQMGPFVIVGILGFFVLIIQTIKTRKKEMIIFLTFPIVYFLYVGSWFTKFIRYMSLVVPSFIIAGSYLLIVITKKFPKLGISLVTFFGILTILWAVAFGSIYSSEQTRITASRWIYNNIPDGSVILGEHWDDGLPIPLGTPSLEPGKYIIDQLTIYDPDDETKALYYADMLSRADYLVINSRRLYGTLMKLPEKYPITSRYYELLFEEKLGYELASSFSSYPTIAGVQINDDSSEETFQVYDHPKVLIFKNTKKLTKQQLLHILD